MWYVDLWLWLCFTDYSIRDMEIGMYMYGRRAAKVTRHSAEEMSHDYDHAARSACGLVRPRRCRRRTRKTQSQFTTDTCK